MRVLLGVVVVTAFLARPGFAVAPGELIVFTRTTGDRQVLFSIRPDGSALRRD